MFNQILVRLLDLQLQYASIKEEVFQAMRAILESLRFIPGAVVEEYEDRSAECIGWFLKGLTCPKSRATPVAPL